MRLKEFEKQFEDLKQKFPALDRTYKDVENCDYCEDIFFSKDCYWVFNGAEMVECYYNTDGYKETNDIDCDNGVNSERCFESTDFADCTDCYYLQHCLRCYNVWHSYMCTDCHDCFGCSNLTHKSYCIFNVQYTKEEYEKKIKELVKEDPKKIQDSLTELNKKFPKINAYYDDAANSEYGDYNYFVKNLYYCFDCSNSEDSGYLDLCHYCKDTWGGIYSHSVERSAEVNYSVDCYGCFETMKCSRCYDSYYLYQCFDCHDCFGCVHLHNKEYCIFNIQYTKEEYEDKVKKLKKDLGIYFEIPKNAIETGKAKKV